MTRREAYNWLRRGSTEGVYFSPEVAGQLAAVLYEAMRSLGDHLPDQPDTIGPLTNLPTVEARLARLEAAHFDDGEWVSEPWRRAVENVSEGAQRDAADLHRRVAVIEKRLIPPNPDGSWALLTTPEATTAIERLETELAELRSRVGNDDLRREVYAQVMGAEKMADAAHERARVIEIELRGMRKSITQLQAQWNNIRNRLKALLSSAS